jgi:hypothetical protein
MMYLWIFKHCLTPNGQVAFKEIRDIVIEDRNEYVPSHLNEQGILGEFDSDRVFQFFKGEELQYYLPMSIFPLVELEPTNKMEYCFYPYNLTSDQEKHVRDSVTEYLVSLDVRELFLPPADVLFKIGNQKYNDAGRPRLDYEMPEFSFDSSFKLQRFLAQPLSPREVWLPGKAIKNNNLFYMIIGKQFLDKDPVYPSIDLDVMFEKLKGIAEGIRFDISGFGLQYLREYLRIFSEVLCELYPSSELEEQHNIFCKILEKTSVELEDGTFVYPPRGIGLGYYESLKTIVMLALLRKYKLYSLYGDQGLIPYESMEAINKLQEYHFILKYEKIEIFLTGKDQTFKWGGIQWSPTGYTKPKAFIDPLIGALFSRQHWERKLALRGLASEHPEDYKKYEYRIAFFYHLFFGYELYKEETFRHFDNCGVMQSTPILNGYIKSWRVEHMVAPNSSIMFDVRYNSPFHVSRIKTVPHKEAKAFSILRKKLYQRSPVIDNSVYLYSNPRIRYNKKQIKASRLLPVWADYLYLANHGRSTGAITAGLSPEDIILAPIRQVFSNDPFRARATGGYEVLTSWRSPRGPSEEMVVASEFLSLVSSRDLNYVRRTDLEPFAQSANDPIYFDDPNLIVKEVSNSLKRKRASDSDLVAEKDTEFQQILESLPKKLSKGTITNAGELVAEIREFIDNQDDQFVHPEVNVMEDDDEYFASLVDEFAIEVDF